MNEYILHFLRLWLRTFLDITSRIIFGLWHIAAKPTVLPPIKNPLVTESAFDLAEKIRTKKITSTEVVTCFIERIREVNPILNALVQDRFEEALKDARKIDKYISDTDLTEEELSEQKPFLGVPFTVKDFFGVKGLKQTCGLWARKNIIAEEDAKCVLLMKEAGAIILGVTNVPEFCMWWETSNTIYGRTNNPYDVNRIPGGSSGGEGCLVSACGSPMGIGTDIGGSIRIPSFFNGVFGHKPTSGVVSNEGLEPKMMGIHDLYSVTGPICKYSKDLLAMYKVLADKEVQRLSLNEKVNLEGINIYYMENMGNNPLISPVSHEITQAQRKVLNHFKDEFGITPVKVNIKYLVDTIEIFFAKLGQEKKAHPYAIEFGNREKPLSPWKECFKWVIGASYHTFAALFLMVRESLLKNADTQKYIEDFDKLKEEMNTLLGKNGVFLYPTHPTNDVYHGESFFRPYNFAYTGIINVLRLPATHCPLGLGSNGLPLGIQVVANEHEDRLSLAVAQEIEKAFGGWVNPSQVL